MFSFLGVGGNCMVDWCCPKCGRKIPVPAAADVRNWEECQTCEHNRKSIEHQLGELNSSALSGVRNRRLQLGIESDYKSEIIELVEKHYGSGKAMQVADILRGE